MSAGWKEIPSIGRITTRYVTDVSVDGSVYSVYVRVLNDGVWRLHMRAYGINDKLVAGESFNVELEGPLPALSVSGIAYRVGLKWLKHDDRLVMAVLPILEALLRDILPAIMLSEL